MLPVLLSPDYFLVLTLTLWLLPLTKLTMLIQIGVSGYHYYRFYI